VFVRMRRLQSYQSPQPKPRDTTAPLHLNTERRAHAALPALNHKIVSHPSPTSSPLSMHRSLAVAVALALVGGAATVKGAGFADVPAASAVTAHGNDEDNDEPKCTKESFQAVFGALPTYELLAIEAATPPTILLPVRMRR
jgi:hypothetical protein